MDGAARAAWLEERRTGLGGTDAAAILGVSPWATAYDVWQEKRGGLAERKDSEAMWWGREMEDLIARRYMEVTGRRVYNPGEMLRHPDHPMLCGTPDRMVLGERRGVEIKTVSMQSAHLWGEPGTDEVPEHYAVQVCHYLLVSGATAWDVVPLFGGNDLRVYTITRDEELLGWMRETLLAWWERHIVGGEEPPITGADSVAKTLARRWPRESLPLVQAEPGTERVAAALAVARQERKAAEESEATLENMLKAAIGEAAGIEGAGWRATWKAAKDSTRTDWRAVAFLLAEQFGAHAQMAAAAEERTTAVPGSRRFLFTRKEAKS